MPLLNNAYVVRVEARSGIGGAPEMYYLDLNRVVAASYQPGRTPMLLAITLEGGTRVTLEGADATRVQALLDSVVCS